MRTLLSSVAVIALAGGLAAAPALAEQDGAMNRTIVVSGVGEVSTAPNIAFLNLGVEAEGATAAEALRKNSAQMEATLKSLRDAGVEKRDIQTSGLNVGAKYDYTNFR